jgi:hypothetical protein
MYFGECLKQRIVSSGFPVRASLLSTATPFFRKLDHHQIIESVARLAPPYSNWPTTDRRRRRAKGASQDARPSTGYGAPLTAHFNRNFRDQEIDGGWRRPLRFERAAGGGRGAGASIFDAKFDRRGKATRSLD